VAAVDLLSGAIVGTALGFALQRSRFCFNSAFRDSLLFKDFTILKAIVIAIILEMVGFQLTSDVGLVKLFPRGLYWGANILGGFMFGVGMVIAGGCISGATYRTGEGMVGSMLALVGISIGAATMMNGALAPFNSFLQKTTEIKLSGSSPTIPLALGISPWFVIIPICILVIALAYGRFRNKKEEEDNSVSLFRKSWPWWLSGLVVGAIAIVSYPLAELAGRSTPLAFTGGYVGILATIAYRDLRYFGWEQTLVIGAIIGSAIAAALSREWKIRTPPTTMAVQSLVGGLLMGAGAVLGDGCNITTILIGVPLLSIGGILAGTFTIFGCWVTAFLMFR
jgi:hypothetical protein